MSVVTASLHDGLDLGDGSCHSPCCSESSCPESYYSQESETTWEEDLADVKVALPENKISLPIIPARASISSSNVSHYSSARSSPIRDLPPHMDLPTLFTTETVRDNDSFLVMDDNVDVKESEGDGTGDLAKQVDLAEALSRSKSPSFLSLEEVEEEDMYNQRGYDEIEQDRIIYLGNDWVKLLAAIEAGVLLRTMDTKDDLDESKSVSESESEYHYPNMRGHPTIASTPASVIPEHRIT
ncbi:hypothetical protein E1B28_013371 [Marasmius oreades]|uniref:Uncharacterized protein n=1 Tax=Marasmius oreades TaxID=181124 RepID=A0A9P7RPG8_9AGAR|nr:uncharacterized protein E1B28_013371 [Marasmius oreades]KAG7087401.1 hypothetical protein E1B28_013371 [Marasmius oreades]